ncbi:hypothetical protein HYH03_010146 [Edaphochlamys debaryana]|uniref:AB hydrolase-1 domain-containing protein n=1 Tax=Edaphochlamys debaryana TaxID=47281 RepID=A0A835XXE9_9CHLO|nr:hypothetical protein HYH03_010146 [Edaphochlamys debaryana]|eukprot:KAG2491579.1 hypothetical protein HYH03_010146 [Edaphochlamys debaryana]
MPPKREPVAAPNGEVYTPSPVLEAVPFPSKGQDLLYLLFAPLLGTYLLLMLLHDFIKRPFEFFRSRPRRHDTCPLPPSLDGLLSRTIDVGDGVQLHAMTWGTRPGAPLVVLLHGFPECWYSWRHVLAAWREAGHEVVAIDMRGYNTSSKPEGVAAYSLDRLTEDVAAVVRALGRSSCTLIGHDWGGAVAWATAGRYPGLVQRLVVMAGPHWLLYKRNMTLAQACMSYYFLWFALPLLPELLLLHTDALFFDLAFRQRQPYSARQGAVTAADVEVYKAAWQQPGAATAALHYYRAALGADTGAMQLLPETSRGLRRRLEMPVLVVWGEKDHALALSNLGDVDQVAPKVQVHVIPGCSHWIQSDAPDAVQRILDDWLAANPV